MSSLRVEKCPFSPSPAFCKILHASTLSSTDAHKLSSSDLLIRRCYSLYDTVLVAMFPPPRVHMHYLPALHLGLRRTIPLSAPHSLFYSQISP